MRFVGIDPATTTGFVALDENGEVLVAKAIRGVGPAEEGGISTEQLGSLCTQLYSSLLPGDEIAKENYAPGTQKSITTGKIHGSLEVMIHFKRLSFNLVNPQWTKKYVRVSGFNGEVGSKKPLKGAEKKIAMKDAVQEHFNWTNKSHDVIDAYILARIAWNIYLSREFLPMVDILPYQIEVVQSILDKKG
jgi:crossover junction endodeoxyribonuclease RuvC